LDALAFACGYSVAPYTRLVHELVSINPAVETLIHAKRFFNTISLTQTYGLDY
jgi:hypothetical protein